MSTGPADPVVGDVVVPGAGSDVGAPVSDLQCTVEDLGNLKRRISVVVPQATIKARLDEEFGKLQDQAQLPGFRKGRAPQRLLEKRFGEEMRKDLKNALVSEGFSQAIRENKLELLGEDDVSELETLQLPVEGDMRFSVVVEVRPTIELPGYEAIPLTRRTFTPTEEEVQQELDKAAFARGHLDPLGPDDALEANDRLTAAITLRIGDEVHEHPASEVFVRGTSIEGVPLPNLGEVLTGRKIGETVELTGTVPADAAKPKAGQTAYFTITIKEARRFVKHPLDDTLARFYGFDTFEQFKAFRLQTLQDKCVDKQKDDLKQQVVQYLTEKTSFELPETLSLRQANQMLVNKLVRLRRMGIPAELIEKEMDQMRAGAAREARDDLRKAFLLDAVANELKVRVSPEEINEQIHQYARYYNVRFDRMRKQLEDDGMLDSLYLDLRNEKILDKLVSMASITDDPAAAAAPSPADGA